MARIVPHGDMSAAEITQCSYDAMAIVALCENASWNMMERGENGPLSGNVSMALKLALELMGEVRDALESHEGVRLSDSNVRSDAAPA